MLTTGRSALGCQLVCAGGRQLRPCGRTAVPPWRRGADPQRLGTFMCNALDFPGNDSLNFNLVLNMLRDKDAMLHDKDADVRSLTDKLEAALRESRELYAGYEVAKEQLKNANNKVLGLRNMRHIRGCLEFAAESVRDSIGPAAHRDGVQSLLDKLARRGSFLQKLQGITQAQNLRKDDVLGCMRRIYHLLSKEMHGCEEVVEIKHSVVTAPGDRAALVAIFEELSIPYVVIDEANQVIQYALVPPGRAPTP